jgi:hypothetical protein
VHSFYEGVFLCVLTRITSHSQHENSEKDPSFEVSVPMSRSKILESKYERNG